MLFLGLPCIFSLFLSYWYSMSNFGPLFLKMNEFFIEVEVGEFSFALSVSKSFLTFLV